MNVRRLTVYAVLGLVLAAIVWLATLDSALAWVAFSLLIAGGLLLLLWLTYRVLQLFLWRVGRRLAFSYFLIGILPVPMAVSLALLIAYIITGFFLGHLYRDAVAGLHSDLSYAAESRLDEFERGRGRARGAGNLAFGYYSNGRRVAGDERAPRRWPDWLEERDRAEASEPLEREEDRRYVLLPDGSPTQAVARSRGNLGVVALYADELETELAQRSDVWVQIVTPEEAESSQLVRVSIGGRQFPLRMISPVRTDAERDAFFALAPDKEPNHVTRPWIWWGEISGAVRNLEDGVVVSDDLNVSLNGNLRNVYRHLFSGSAEVDTAVWAGLIGVAGLLATIYGVALLMATFMIFTLSRSVNQLSRATNSVRSGDFSVRMPARRRDQVGELQRSFNEMTENLQLSVAAAAEQEILENELAIARDLQQSLIPQNLPAMEAVEFATMFEPSAAIGGDYFDLLPIDDHRLAVVVADVAGHGLSTGLRMAMLKAALVILVEEAKPADQILHRLSAMIRASEEERRYFVTCTLSVVDVERGSLELTNAGHPPTYLLRAGAVREIVLPGPPLGALEDAYGYQKLELEPGDVVVWLSDGLIEATDAAGEPFGYEGIVQALEGPAPNADVVRARLLAAVSDHAGDQPVEDDQTLVVMRYLSPEAAAGSTPSVS